MIKSIFDDEDEQGPGAGEKRGILKKRRAKDELLSINPDANEDPSIGRGESEEEIRNGILGLSEPPRRQPAPDPPDEKAPARTSARPMTGDGRGTSRTAELEKKLREIEKELERERELEALEIERERGPVREVSVPEPSGQARDPGKRAPNRGSEITFGGAYSSGNEIETEDPSDVFRRTGLAWSAAIALFGSVAFMLALGWIADVLLGSSPWGIVVGIVVGSVIGFLQFFRVTARINNPSAADFERLSLRSSEAGPTDEDGAVGSDGPSQDTSGDGAGGFS